jgi:tRNA (guanine10-N2)-dimethyltransferase
MTLNAYLRLIKVGSRCEPCLRTDSVRVPAPPSSVVYALELAGDHDALAILEAASAASDVRAFAPGVAIAETVQVDRVRQLAFTRRASEVLVHGEGALTAATAALSSVDHDRTGSVAVRARDVRGTAEVDTQAAERALGRELVEAGFEVDLDSPSHELRACFADDHWVLGWLIAESRRDYGQRRPTDRPFFQPGGMAPLLARALANIAIGARSPQDITVLDPMCGTGGILAEASLVGAPVIGGDAQTEMVRGTRRNLGEVVSPDRFDVLQVDAASLPFQAGAVEAIVFDAPYGRQSRVAGHEAGPLVSAALREAHRVAPRAVVVGDHPLEETARAAGWTIRRTLSRPVHGSLTRHIHLLE